MSDSQSPVSDDEDIMAAISPSKFRRRAVICDEEEGTETRNVGKGENAAQVATPTASQQELQDELINLQDAPLRTDSIEADAELWIGDEMSSSELSYKWKSRTVFTKLYPRNEIK